MALLLGLLVAVSYGCGDFCGGLASRRSATLAVVAWSFVVSAACLGLLLVGWDLLGAVPRPAGSDLALGAVIGCLSPIGLGLLYRGLAIGRMSVVAPTTAVVAAALPVVYGLADGERPSLVALAGVAVALVSVVLVSSGVEGQTEAGRRDHPPVPTRQVLPIALGAGGVFGVVYILLGSASATAGVWPLAVARPLSVLLVTVTGAAWATRHGRSGRQELVVVRGGWSLVAVAGALDIVANALYLAATRRGYLSIVAVVASLYPAGTVAMARLVLGERLHRTQVYGLLLAGVGVAAMALG